MSNTKTIAITGGSGFVGQHIAKLLSEAGHRVIIYSRSPKAGSGNISSAAWNPTSRTMDTQSLARVDALIHLAGAGVADKRWTKAYKQEIIKSRVDATHFLHEMLQQHASQCKAFVAASATGYYGPDRPGLIPFHEEAPPDTDFLASVCAQWEAASLAARERYRTVILRTGIVLGKEGGAYPRLTQPMSFGIMPILGNGRQVVSWIHVDDLARLFISAVLSENFDGVYNAVAPHPVTHRAMMIAIAQSRAGIKIPVPVPSFVLKIIMGEASVEVLKSCTVSCEKVSQAGFQFNYQEIESAAKDLA